MGSTAPQSATSTMPEIPESETYITHGLIVNSSSGGGGYTFAPGYTQHCIEKSDGSCNWFTLSTYQAMKYPCTTCQFSPPPNRASCYGSNSWVLVTSLHNHCVIRLLDEQYRH